MKGLTRRMSKKELRLNLGYSPAQFTRKLKTLFSDKSAPSSWDEIKTKRILTNQEQKFIIRNL